MLLNASSANPGRSPSFLSIFCRFPRSCRKFGERPRFIESRKSLDLFLRPVYRLEDFGHALVHEGIIPGFALGQIGMGNDDSQYVVKVVSNAPGKGAPAIRDLIFAIT